jgi:hypothetical protein
VRKSENIKHKKITSGLKDVRERNKKKVFFSFTFLSLLCIFILQGGFRNQIRSKSHDV